MVRKRLEQGHIQVYTGDGKGKTTCAFGLALRAVGQGLQVYFIQFLKGQDTGEIRAAERLAPELTLKGFGRPVLVNLKNPAPEDLALAREALNLASRVIAAGDHDLVILDEINVAMAYNLIPVGEVLDMVRRRPPQVEVVLTGRAAPPEIIKAADLVTEMVPRKHYWEAGIKARRGIEW
jgi:cob(I)alamin adenosyltransferase